MLVAGTRHTVCVYGVCFVLLVHVCTSFRCAFIMQYNITDRISRARWQELTGNRIELDGRINFVWSILCATWRWGLSNELAVAFFSCYGIQLHIESHVFEIPERNNVLPSSTFFASISYGLLLRPMPNHIEIPTVIIEFGEWERERERERKRPKKLCQMPIPCWRTYFNNGKYTTNTDSAATKRWLSKYDLLNMFDLHFGVHYDGK